MHNMLKVNNNDTRTTLIDIVLVSLMLTLNIFRTFSDVSIVDFDHGFVCLEFTWTNMNSKNENSWKVTFSCQFFFFCIFHLKILRKFSFCSLGISGTFFSPNLFFKISRMRFASLLISLVRVQLVIVKFSWISSGVLRSPFDKSHLVKDESFNLIQRLWRHAQASVCYFTVSFLLSYFLNSILQRPFWWP